MLLLHHPENLDLIFYMESILTLTLFPHCLPTSQLGLRGGFGDWHPTELCHLHVRDQERRFKDVPCPGQTLVNTLQRLRPSRASCTAPCPAQAQWKCYNTGHQPWEKCSFHKYVWVFQPITRPAIILHILLYTYKVDGEDKRIQSLESTKLALDGNLEVLTSCHSKNKNGSFIFGIKT